MTTDFARDMVLDRKTYPAGSDIFRAGSSGSTAYLLLQGEVEIRAPGPDGAVLTTLKPGQVFGELALLNHETRSATAHAVQKCDVAVISSETFKRKLAQADPFLRYWIEYLGQRVLALTQRTG